MSTPCRDRCLLDRESRQLGIALETDGLVVELKDNEAGVRSPSGWWSPSGSRAVVGWVTS